MYIRKVISYALFALLLVSCSKDENMNYKLKGESAGGETTVYISNSQAFGTPATNLSSEHLDMHLNGDKAFEAIFVSSPAPTHGGLGPIFNNSSCNACHPSDARASVPENINELSGFFFRISIEGTDEHGGPKPVPGFGTQLQHQSLFGYEPEAKMERKYQPKEIVLSDGVKVILQKPLYSIIDPYIELPENVLISPRIGMPVFGLGLLEAIPEKDILANADEFDADKDGVSGKPNYVWDTVTETVQLGRFGWKAGAANILAQSAGAYSGDMGLTTRIFTIESSYGQSNGSTETGIIEVSDEELNAVAFYCQTLGVPAARNLDNKQVINGSKIFKKIGCAQCHTPSFKTGNNPDIPELSNQTIYPYTDMLLHDMGEELADNRSEYKATGSEWKTRPLWGIGLTNVTSGHTSFLHDGRARNITEAILWHGGEAENSRNSFIDLSTQEREALLAFVNAL